MKFGKVESITGIDFRLPPDPEGTEEILGRFKKDPKRVPQLYFGSPVWTCKDWVGDLFPPKTKPADYLFHYSRQLTSVELNSMFYRIPPATTLEKWRETAPEGFLFCPKINQLISQYPNLRGPEGMTEDFISAARMLEPRLGMTFLQLPPAFGPDRLDHLQRFLQEWPRDLELGVEFRHPDWFETDAGFALLESFGKTAVITDTAGRRDVLHMRLTAPKVLVRWAGNNLHPTDYARLDEWIERIGKWLRAGLQTVYFFIHVPEEHLGPQLVNYFIEKINAREGLQLKPWKSFREATLF
ncbi:MAG: DUF72 domain-containing protein [Bacteroidia bacterium]|nr:DUF72 domain-containing protein [Bacteroidia bacterium]